MQLNLTEVDLAGALANVLETTAFMTPLPPEEPLGCPEQALLAAIAITTDSGEILRLELVCGLGLGLAIAGNLLGMDPSEDGAPAAARDAIKEIMNVTAGTIIPNLPGFGSTRYEMSIPQLTAFDGGWESYTAGATTLDVEGHSIAIRLRT